MASNPQQPIQDTGKKVYGATSKAVGTGAKYLVRYLTGGASTAVDSFIPWKWIGAFVIAILLGIMATVGMIIFMFTGASSGSSGSSANTASSTTGGGSFNAGPISCASVPSQMITDAQSAGSYYHIPWEWSLAIAKNETAFGTYSPPLLISSNGLAGFDMASSQMHTVNPQNEISSTGAVGTTQFLPSTWSGSRAPGISAFNVGVPYSTVLSGVQFQTNPSVIQQYGGYGDAYWLAHGKPSGMIANPFNPQQAIWATSSYIASLYHSTRSWAGALHSYSGNSAGYYRRASGYYQQISKC